MKTRSFHSIDDKRPLCWEATKEILCPPGTYREKAQDIKNTINRKKVIYITIITMIITMIVLVLLYISVICFNQYN